MGVDIPTWVKNPCAVQDAVVPNPKTTPVLAGTGIVLNADQKEYRTSIIDKPNTKRWNGVIIIRKLPLRDDGGRRFGPSVAGAVAAVEDDDGCGGGGINEERVFHKWIQQ